MKSCKSKTLDKIESNVMRPKVSKKENVSFPVEAAIPVVQLETCKVCVFY